MKILFVASYNKERFAPFIVEQAEVMRRAGCDIVFFGLQGKGYRGYLKNLPALKLKIKEFHPHLIHAHYGLSGLLANFQRKVPVVTTYHGSDINDRKVLPFSRLAMRFSVWNIFVSQKTLEIAKPNKKYSLLPCGIDLTDLQLTEKQEARRKMHLSLDKKYILFAGAFDNPVKNAQLAQKTVAQLNDPNIELLELKGYSRDEVTLLMCAVDAFLMTSFTEGSPQVIKEAMACGCSIVSVDVGDVKERVEGIEGCYVARMREPNELAELLLKAMSFVDKTKGRERIFSDGLENGIVARKLMEVYDKALKR